MARHKHMTLDDRNTICSMLSSGSTLTKIANTLDRDVSTIRKEILNHREFSKQTSPGRTYNNCKNRKHCEFKKKCEKCLRPEISSNICRRCSLCNDMCSHYVPDDICKRKDKKPYCCNGCTSFNTCTLSKYIYRPETAHKQYKETLVSSREGLNITPEEIKQMAEIISPLIKDKKQSIHAVVTNNADSFTVSERTLYRYIDEGLFDARNIDLPRKVRFLPRKSKPHHKVDRACREGRDYISFENYMKENPGTDVVEIDSVEGPKGTPCLLTLYFRSCSLQLAFIRNSNDSGSVISVFNHLYDVLGKENFEKLFPVILADNGSEFSNPKSIENHYVIDGATGEITEEIRRTRVFYCNPSSPFQKGACERNHEFIRYFVPKGKAFSDFSQEDINLMMNHINSYTRAEKKNLRTPTSRFIFIYGEEIADLLGIKPIDANEVTLSRVIFSK